MNSFTWIIICGYVITIIVSLVQSQNAPVINNLAGTTSVDETETAQTSLFVVDVTDADGDPLTITIVSGNTDSNFDIDNSTGEVYLVANPPALDADAGTTSYTLTIDATDGTNNVQDTLTITVNQIEEIPVITGSSLSVQVNESNLAETVVYSGFTASGADPEGDSLTFECTITPDDGSFWCNSTSGEVSNFANPNYTSSVYEVNIRLSDGKITSRSKTLTINVNNQWGDPPYFINLPNTTYVTEYNGAGFNLFTADIRDPDDNMVSVTNISVISVAPNVTQLSTFNIDGATGILSLTASLDYNLSPTYDVTLRACDVDGCSVETLTIVVEDSLEVDWDPIIIRENTGTPFVIDPKWNVTDVGGQTLVSWTLLSNPAGPHIFEISSANGHITHKAPSLDYENLYYAGAQPPTIILDVELVDDTGRTATAAVTVYVDDVDEYPPVYAQDSYSGVIVEGVSEPSILDVSATDDDGGPVYGEITYSLGEPGNSYFGVTTNADGTGTIYTLAAVDRDALSYDEFVFLVLATDGGQLYDTATVTVSVTSVDEFGPVSDQNKFTFLVSSNAQVGFDVGFVSATDFDGGERMLYHVITNTSSTLPLILSMHDGKVVVDGDLTAGTTYTFWAYAESCPHVITETTCPAGSKTSQPFEIEVITFDGVGTIVNWEIETTDTYFGADDIAIFEANLEATCTPCTPVVASTTVNDNGNVVLGVYIIDGNTNSGDVQYWSKSEILQKYTTDNIVTPTTESEGVAPSGKVVAISEAYETEPSNWLLDTIPGNVVLAGICLAVFGGISTLIAFIYTKAVINPKHRKYDNLA